MCLTAGLIAKRRIGRGTRGSSHRKRMCAPPLPLNQVMDKVRASHAADDWRGVLNWEGRMEELIEGQADTLCDWVLGVFGNALQLAMTSTGSLCYVRSSVGLYARRPPWKVGAFAGPRRRNVHARIPPVCFREANGSTAAVPASARRRRSARLLLRRMPGMSWTREAGDE